MTTPQTSWAALGMPVLRSIRGRLARERPLAGLRVGVGLFLDPQGALDAKGTHLAAALHEAGAEVNLAPTAQACLGARPDIVLDDGLRLTTVARRSYPDLSTSMLGIIEATITGSQLRAQHDSEPFARPVIAVDDSPISRVVAHGAGQACVFALLDLTNLQLAGRTVVVVGYGHVGEGVARHAGALGARVVVSEVDPVRALRAVHDGYRVRSLTDAAPEAAVVIAATGQADAVAPAHLERMRDGVIMCAAGGAAVELPLEHLETLSAAIAVRPGARDYALADGRSVLVVGDGARLSSSDAEGLPVEIADLSLSLQLLATELIATRARDWTPGVYPVPAEAEAEVAQARLDHEGATLQR